MKPVILAAGLAAALLPASVQASSSPWQVERFGPRGIAAVSCTEIRRGTVCAVVTCRPQRGMRLELRGLREAREGRRVGGLIAIDRRARPVSFVFDVTRRGASRWIAEIGPPRGFWRSMRAGNRMAVEIGPRRRPLLFSLRGSSRAIGAVRHACRGGSYY